MTSVTVLTGETFTLPGTVNLFKGQRVRLQVSQYKLPGESWSLAGAMLKFPMTNSTIEGEITHVRGDRLVDPTNIGVWIRQEDGQEVIVNARWIVAAEILPDPANAPVRTEAVPAS